MKRIIYTGMVLFIVCTLLFIFWPGLWMKTPSVFTPMTPASTGAISGSLRPPTPLNAYTSRIVRAFSSPIVFYGKVVDEANKPIAGVNVNFTVTTLENAFNERANPQAKQTFTDAKGLFTISGVSGGSLDITPSKDGYTNPAAGSGSGTVSVSYAISGTDSIAPSEDPANPHIFHLKANLSHEPVLTGQVYGDYDFNPLLKKYDDALVSLQSVGTLVLSYNISPPYKGDYDKPHDWSYSITIKGGGIQEMNDPESQLAPADGYKESATFQMLKSSPKWDFRITAKCYYIKFPNGCFGKIETYFSTDSGMAIRYTCNPKPGSRFLSLPGDDQYIGSE